MKIIDSS